MNQNDFKKLVNTAAAGACEDPPKAPVFMGGLVRDLRANTLAIVGSAAICVATIFANLAHPSVALWTAILVSAFMAGWQWSRLNEAFVMVHRLLQQQNAAIKALNALRERKAS